MIPTLLSNFMLIANDWFGSFHTSFIPLYAIGDRQTDIVIE